MVERNPKLFRQPQIIGKNGEEKVGLGEYHKTQNLFTAALYSATQIQLHDWCGRCLIVSVVVLILLVVDLEVAQFVRVSRRRDHAQPVTQVVLLQVLLRQVLQVPSTESTWMKQQVLHRQVLQVPRVHTQ